MSKSEDRRYRLRLPSAELNSFEAVEEGRN